MRAFAPLRAAAALAAFSLLGGCYSYHLDHRETIGESSGDALAINSALQIKDPWPRRAWDKTIHHDGTRMGNAIEAYRTPKPVAADANESGLDQLATGPSTTGE